MTHAIARRPIDVCRARGEDKVVVGNSGVLRVLKAGAAVKGLKEGDVGALFGGARVDGFGYMTHAHGYDAPGTIGVLAKRTKIPAWMFLPFPASAPYSYEQWAAFSLRYLTAWSNWKVALGAYRLQMSEAEDPAPHVWAWGGGTTLAEIDLARRHGCQVAMISGNDDRLEALARMDIFGADRRRFPAIEFDDKRYAADPAYRKSYQESEQALLEMVKARTGGRGVAIFLDYIGAPVLRATLKALARQGVLSTAGWMLGMITSTNRAIECIARHLHVHTHYARPSDWSEARDYALRTGWMPEVTEIYDWDQVPALARDAAAGANRSYFPVYCVNRV